MVLFMQALAFAQTKLVGSHQTLALVEAKRVDLEENLRKLSHIASVAPVGQNKFVVSSIQPANLVLYNEKGRQIDTLGRWGQGPYEYGSPHKIKSRGDTIFVWDENAVKFILYQENGLPLKEITGFSEAISNFIYFDNRFVLYLAGGRRAHFIAVYDVGKKSMVRTFGLRNSQHDMLMFYAGSGGLASRGDVVFYASPAENTIHLMNLKNFEEQSCLIRDSEFKVEKKNLDFSSAATFEEMKEYLFNNSRVCGLHILGKFIVAEIEDGRTDEQTRTTKLFIFDLQLNALDTITLNYAMREKLGSNVRCNDAEHVYFVSESDEDEANDIQRTLTGWRIVSLEPE